MTAFTTKDSGARQEYDSGMVRDLQAGKPRFDLMLAEGVPYDEQLLTRFAALLERGAGKYGERNWEKAAGQPELDRAKASAFRHLVQWLCGEDDEDHAAAVMFNLTMAEYVKYRMQAGVPRTDDPACFQCGGTEGDIVTRRDGRHMHAYGACDANGSW